MDIADEMRLLAGLCHHMECNAEAHVLMRRSLHLAAMEMPEFAEAAETFAAGLQLFPHAVERELAKARDAVVEAIDALKMQDGKARGVEPGLT